MRWEKVSGKAYLVFPTTAIAASRLSATIAFRQNALDAARKRLPRGDEVENKKLQFNNRCSGNPLVTKSLWPC